MSPQNAITEGLGPRLNLVQALNGTIFWSRVEKGRGYE